MSRNINNKSYEAPLLEHRSGSLIITEYHERNMAFYIDENRLKAACVLHYGREEDHLGDVFIGRISKVVHNANACFVEYKKGVNGFLPFSELEEKRWKEGDLLPVQLMREPIKTKPATLSGRISISDEYFVLTYGDSSGIGVSKKLPLQKKTELLEWIKESGMVEKRIAVVVRTLAGELSKESFLQEYISKMQNLQSILLKAEHGMPFHKIYSNDLVLNELYRTFKPSECMRVVTDSTKIYQALKEASVKLQNEVTLYQDDFSIRKLYKLDSMLDEALKNRVWLKSGANIIIEQLESLTAIDVNSGKGTLGKGAKAKEKDQRLQINLEAAKEIALQLRLRNISGMIIIDFINMEEKEEKELLLQKMKEYVADDLLPVNVIDYTALGLMELTRKKGMKSLREQMRGNHETTEI